ncbi:MAG: helix-turn-helix transcriptional regulator [Burkholderiaceae bacterium]
MKVTVPHHAQTDQLELLSPRDLAARWGLSEKTLERWRSLGAGPSYIRLGGRVRYRRDDVLKHESRHVHRRIDGEVA